MRTGAYPNIQAYSGGSLGVCQYICSSLLIGNSPGFLVTEFIDRPGESGVKNGSIKIVARGDVRNSRSADI